MLPPLRPADNLLNLVFSVRTGAPAAERKPKGAHQAREADITLAEPHLQDYMLRGFEGADEFGQAGFEGEGELGAIFGEEEQVSAPLTTAGEQLLICSTRRACCTVSRRNSTLRFARDRLGAAAPLAQRGDQPASERRRVRLATEQTSAGSTTSAFVRPPALHGADSSRFSSFAGQEFGGGGEEFFPPAQLPGEGEETFAERVRKEHEEAQARLEQAGGRVSRASGSNIHALLTSNR